MKYMKTFVQLNEGISESSNLENQFIVQLKTIDDISKAISGSSYMKDVLKTVQKEKPEIAKTFKGYFDLSSKAQKLVKAVKSKGLSKHPKKAQKQLSSLKNLAVALKEGLNNLKTFKKKTESESKNEGLGNIIGNALRNVLTGRWIINLMKSVRANMVDSYNEFGTVEDVFDLKDY